jgi:hypothetical protein
MRLQVAALAGRKISAVAERKTNSSPLDGGDAVSPKSHFAKRAHLSRHPEALARQSRASLEGRTAWQLRNRAASFEALASLGHLRMTADDGGCVRQDKPAQVTFGKTKSRVGSMSYEARGIEVTFRKTNCGGNRRPLPVWRVWQRSRISQNRVRGSMPGVAAGSHFAKRVRDDAECCRVWQRSRI